MGWREAKLRYLSGTTPANQSSEDIVARRVLRGLGVSQRDIYAVETKIFGQISADEALWPRVKAILNYAFYNSMHAHLLKRWYFETCSTDKTHKTVLDKIHLGAVDGKHPVFFAKKPNTKLAITYSLWEPLDLSEELEPPFYALTRYDNLILVLQSTEHFISQFRDLPRTIRDDG